jgi:hypothetical protein
VGYAQQNYKAVFLSYVTTVLPLKNFVGDRPGNFQESGEGPATGF